MDFEVVLTRKASNDLSEIAKYIARDDPRLAESFTDELIHETNPLSAFPQMGRLVPEFGEDIYRELIHPPYRIIYRVLRDRQQIHILRFWHGARGNPQL
jgi:addiction module RelE/StbE family toxin